LDLQLEEVLAILEELKMVQDLVTLTQMQMQ
jgi:hypothetical protein